MRPPAPSIYFDAQAAAAAALYKNGGERDNETGTLGATSKFNYTRRRCATGISASRSADSSSRRRTPKLIDSKTIYAMLPELAGSML